MGIIRRPQPPAGGARPRKSGVKLKCAAAPLPKAFGYFGHLPGAFLEIFFWFQKATLGTSLPLNVSRACGRATAAAGETRLPRTPLSTSPWPCTLRCGHVGTTRTASVVSTQVCVHQRVQRSPVSERVALSHCDGKTP